MSYTAQAQAAHRMLVRKGATMTLRRIVRGTLNVDTNVAASSVQTDYPVVAAIVPIGRNFGTRDQTFEAHAMVRTKARKIILSALAPTGVALAVTPQSGDRLIAPSETYTLAGVTTINPDGGAAALHVCEATK